jgi:hypothetical protein
MRRHLVTALIAAAASFLVALATRAPAGESLTLEARDRLVAEAPGCQADCRLQPSGSRICAVEGSDCRAVCRELPECVVEPGGQPLRACALVKGRP